MQVESDENNVFENVVMLVVVLVNGIYSNHSCVSLGFCYISVCIS